MIRAVFNRLVQAPPPTAWQALSYGAIAIAVPTLIRLAVDGRIGGCELTPYLPFVLVSAILLRWWQAAVVALGSIAAFGLVFGIPPADFLGSSCVQSSAGLFLVSSAAVIGVAALVRSTLAAAHRRDANDALGGIVFSLERGDVWASWYGNAAPVRLGTQTKVASMMEDFLAQVEIGKRLSDPSS